MSPLEAYFHIRAILEHLNAVVAEQFASLMFEKSVSVTAEASSLTQARCLYV
jgi:hypothetical protein